MTKPKRWESLQERTRADGYRGVISMPVPIETAQRIMYAAGDGPGARRVKSAAIFAELSLRAMSDGFAETFRVSAELVPKK